MCDLSFSSTMVAAASTFFLRTPYLPLSDTASTSLVKVEVPRLLPQRVKSRHFTDISACPMQTPWIQRELRRGACCTGWDTTNVTGGLRNLTNVAMTDGMIDGVQTESQPTRMGFRFSTTSQLPLLAPISSQYGAFSSRSHLDSKDRRRRSVGAWV